MNLTLFCMAINLFPHSLCELPRPHQPEPEAFQYGYISSNSGFADLQEAQRFVYSLPRVAPIPTLAVRTPPKPKRPSNYETVAARSIPTKVEQGAKNLVRESDVGPKRGLFASLFSPQPKFNLAAPRVDINKQGYQEVVKAAKKHGVDVNLALRVAKQESGGSCKARSHADARGVMQVIPRTGAIHGYSASDLYNCSKGAEAGVREIKRLMKMFDNDLRKVLIGYNCGPKCVTRKRLPKETQHYIKVIGGYTK